MVFVSILTAAVALSLSGGTAHAARYNFSYAIQDGSIIRGALEGTRQADSNLVLVEGIYGAPTIDGLAFPEVDILTKYSIWNDFGTFEPGVVSFDGTVVDLLATNAAFSQGFGLMSGKDENDFGYVIAVLGAVPHFDRFRADDWSLTAAVPETGTWLLMLAGFGLTGAALRHRRVNLTA